MSIFEISTLFFIMLSLAIIPSSSVALVVSRSATLGFANGVAVTLGIILGDLVFIVLAIWGLSYIAESMADVFIVVKVLGAFYLIFLAYSLITTLERSFKITSRDSAKRDLLTSFLAGLALTLADVKAIIFYVSVFPMFIDLAHLLILDVVIIVVLMVISVGGVKLAYTFFAVRLAQAAQQHNVQHYARNIAAMLLLLAGIFMLIKEFLSFNFT